MKYPFRIQLLQNGKLIETCAKAKNEIEAGEQLVRYIKYCETYRKDITDIQIMHTKTTLNKLEIVKTINLNL